MDIGELSPHQARRVEIKTPAGHWLALRCCPGRRSGSLPASGLPSHWQTIHLYGADLFALMSAPQARGLLKKLNYHSQTTPQGAKKALAKLFPACLQRHDLPRPAFDQCPNMVSPQSQCRADLALIDRSVVNASNAAAMPTVVVQNSLDHVRLHAKIRHARGNGPPDIVQSPRLDRGPEALVEV